MVSLEVPRRVQPEVPEGPRRRQCPNARSVSDSRSLASRLPGCATGHPAGLLSTVRVTNPRDELSANPAHEWTHNLAREVKAADAAAKEAARAAKESEQNK